MATTKVFALGGIDLRSNDLTRPTEKASDMLNMEYEVDSSLKKRYGYSAQSVDGSTSVSYDDLVPYLSKDEQLAFTNGSSSVKVLKRGSNFTTRTLSLPAGISSLNNISISYTENQNNLYFTNTDYLSYVMKYDGSNLYRAGLPTPRLGDASKQDKYPSFTNSVTGFNRFFYSYKDINGNLIYSPYTQTTAAQGAVSGSSVISINSLKTDTNCLENGFFDRYCYRDSTTTATITNASTVLTVIRHNYVAGDKFLIDTENKFITISPVGKTFLVLDIQSVTPTTITFTAASIGVYTISFAVGTPYYSSEYPVDVRTKLNIYSSSAADTNYVLQLVFVIDNSSIINTISGSKVEAVLNLNLPAALDFEDVYDSTTLKIMPPICKFIASFGNQMVYGSIDSFFTTFDHYLNAPNQRISYANHDLIIYSDVSTGDGPENVSELNRQKIGETMDGDINGLRRCNDSLIIFKTRGVFSIDGDLIQGQYSLRKINTNYSGCTSHKSILQAEEGLYYQSHDGIYFTNGINARKVTDAIDSIFGSASYPSTRAVRMKKRQKAIFYVPELSKVVVIDYNFNQIYIWNSIDASKGIIEDMNGDVYFSNGSLLLKMGNSGYSDNGAAISAYYSTTWHHCGEPSLLKKWNSIRTFALTTDAFTATMKTEGDWNPGVYLTNNTVTYGALTQTDFKMLNMQTKRSMRFTFSNNTLNENLVITGYELTWEPFNGVDKN